ncbi:MAG TPA: hypothetical protein PLO61_11285 [Fimbriimonadaceae bacterium]|nr:hypothetical protein [Fimbriimonadaceae bacterium]HRJ34264.1 hypothetical protein [Fimbriimonadaceae bacterium]
MQFFVAIYRPLDYKPEAAEDSLMRAEIDALNDEMVAAGVREFVGGLHPVHQAQSVEVREDGSLGRGVGPISSAGMAIGGFWVLQVADESEALCWAEKASRACRAPVEVRRFHGPADGAG